METSTTSGGFLTSVYMLAYLSEYLPQALSATMQVICLSSQDTILWCGNMSQYCFTSYVLKLCILPVNVVLYVLFMPTGNIQIRVQPHCRPFQPRITT